ncbi:MAG: T9SS type A sorting domain-containing protein [Bacteroidales bacterium]
MKKIFFLFCSLLGLVPGLESQIVLQHSFNDQASVGIQQVKLGPSGKKYCLINKLDSITYECALFNADFTSFKTITINLGSHFASAKYKDPQLEIRYISEPLFDSDPDVDLLAELSYLDDNDDLYAQVLIFHENGSTLFASDIQNTNAWLVNQSVANAPMAAGMVTTATGTVLILDAFYFGEGLYKYDVYSIPGVLPSTINSPKSGETDITGVLEAFPNPANDMLMLRYSIPEGQTTGVVELTDNQGRILRTIAVDGRQGTLRISVSDLESGIYYSRISSRRGLPRAKMLMIAH